MAGIDPNTGQTSLEEIQRKRLLAQMMMQGAMQPQRTDHNTPLIAALLPLAQAFAASRANTQAMQGEQAVKGQRQSELAKIMAAAQGTPGQPGMTPLTPMDDDGNVNTVIAPTPAVPGGREAMAQAMIGSSQPDIQTAGFGMIGKMDDAKAQEARRIHELEVANQYRATESEANRRSRETEGEASRQNALAIAKLTADSRRDAAKDKADAKTNLSPTAQKELFEADDAVVSSQNAIGLLEQGLKLNDKAYSGPFAKQRAQGVSLLPGESEAANASIDLDNLMTGQALETLRATFGGMPTEGERKILLEMQASLDKTPAQRKEILHRAIALAKRREQVGSEKAKALRGGTFFKESPVPQTQTPAGASSGGIKFLGFE